MKLAVLTHMLVSCYLPRKSLQKKIINRNTRKICEICSVLTISTPKQSHWHRSADFTQNSHILGIYLFPGLDTTSVSAYVQLHVRLCLYVTRCITKLHFRKDEKIYFI